MSAVMPTVEAAVRPLTHGEEMDFDEFVARWDATPGLEFAELVNGVVRIMPPLSFQHHGRPDGKLGALLSNYEVFTPGVAAGNNATAQLDIRSGPQADGMLLILSEAGGQARLRPDGVVEGAPELVAETAHTSARYDLGEKLELYRRSGVREYVVFQPRHRMVQWFALDTAPPAPLRELQPDMHGVIRSEAFPGLWLHVPGLLTPGPTLVMTLLQGVNSPEHAAFVQKLADLMAGRPPAGP